MKNKSPCIFFTSLFVFIERNLEIGLFKVNEDVSWSWRNCLFRACLLLLRDIKQLSIKLYGDSNSNICFPYLFNVIIFCLWIEVQVLGLSTYPSVVLDVTQKIFFPKKLPFQADRWNPIARIIPVLWFRCCNVNDLFFYWVNSVNEEEIIQRMSLRKLMSALLQVIHRKISCSK